MGWLTGWSFRKSHVINGSIAGAQTSYQVRVVAHKGTGTDSGQDVYLGANVRDDFGDVRFTKDDGETLLDYWMESLVSGDKAVFWVELPSIPASPGSTTIYIYYGKSDATTTSNGEKTFVFFDNAQTNKSASYTLRDSYNPGLNASLIYDSVNKRYEVDITGHDEVLVEINVVPAGASYEVWSRQMGVMGGANRNLQYGIMMRYSSAGVYYGRKIHSGTLYTLHLSKEPTPPNTSVVTLGSVAETAGVPDNAWYQVKGHAYGSSLWAWHEHQNKTVTATDTAYASGTWGLFIAYEADDLHYFKDVVVRKYVDPEPSHGAWGAEAEWIAVTVTDQLGMVDSVAKRADLKQAVTDQLGMVDSAVAPGTLHLSVADQLGMLDSVAKARGQKVSVAESLGMVDALVPRRGHKQTITDALGLLDSTVPRRGLKQTVSEQLGLLDSAVPRSLMRRPTNGLDHTTIGGVPRDPDLPDNVEAIYVSVKNTWQDADNLDDEHGYRSYIWIPEETFQVRIMKLHVYAEKFRAYSKAALSKDLGTKTSVGGGAHRHMMFDYIGVSPGGWDLHEYQCQRADETLGRTDQAMAWVGDVYTYETVPAHTHDVVLGSHDHDIVFGIYEEAIAGRTLSAKLYDPDGNLVKDFGVITTGEADLVLDLSEYFEELKYGMYYLDLAASGRLRARLVFYELCLMYAY